MKKDKAVVIESPSTNEEEEDAVASNHSARRFSTRNASSKYDFVKVYIRAVAAILFHTHIYFLFNSVLVLLACLLLFQVKVWLGDNADHYYVLSRFLLSRMLTVTKVQHPSFSRLCLLNHMQIYNQLDD